MKEEEPQIEFGRRGFLVGAGLIVFSIAVASTSWCNRKARTSERPKDQQRRDKPPPIIPRRTLIRQSVSSLLSPFTSAR